MRSEAKFFLDRGVGSRIVPDGLRDAGWVIVTMDERYGKGASQIVLDVDWIRDASAEGDIIISKDRAIAKRPLEAEAIYVNDARALVIASAHITGPEMLGRLIFNGDKIERQSLRSGPYVLGVHADTLGDIRLNYP